MARATIVNYNRPDYQRGKLLEYTWIRTEICHSSKHRAIVPSSNLRKEGFCIQIRSRRFREPESQDGHLYYIKVIEDCLASLRPFLVTQSIPASSHAKETGSERGLEELIKRCRALELEPSLTKERSIPTKRMWKQPMKISNQNGYSPFKS